MGCPALQCSTHSPPAGPGQMLCAPAQGGEGKPGFPTCRGPATSTRSGLVTLKAVHPPCWTCLVPGLGVDEGSPTSGHLSHVPWLPAWGGQPLPCCALKRHRIHPTAWSRGGGGHWLRVGRGARSWRGGQLGTCPRDQGPLRSPGSKSPVPVSLSHEVSCTEYKLKGKVVGNCKMVTTEH